MTEKKKGVLVILSGPTCAGKDVVMRELLERNKNMIRLVTTNSREKRPEEVEGVDYYFVSREEFEKMIVAGDFFEWVEYRGEYRGGQKLQVLQAIDSGQDVIWRIDVRGVKNIYDKVKEQVSNSVFILLISPIEILRQRAEKRKTEDKKWTDWSMDMAKWEMDQKENFDFVVENKEDQLTETVNQIETIIEKIRRKSI